MTRNRSFKRLVRERMARTGERYATARSHLLPDGSAQGFERSARFATFPGVDHIGGRQPDLAAAANLCSNAGVTGPDGRPLTEAMAFGLAGGIGFLYGVFVYNEGPTMTIVCRNRSMPDPFVEPLFAAVGADVDIATTGGAKKAAATLDAALSTGTPTLCTVGAGGLGYLGESPSMAGMAPHLVGVIGVADDGDLVLVDDRSPEPIPIDRAEFDRARAAYRKAKHRLVTVSSVDDDHDWGTAVRSAVTAGATGFDTPPVPRFASNVGLTGLRKFRTLLTDGNDGKGWPRVFGDGRNAAIGLSRLHDCVDHAYTAPSAGRPLYADFLDEAAAVMNGAAGGDDRADGADAGATAEVWSEAAAGLRRSGEAWSTIVAAVTAAHPDLARYGELAAERAAGLDAGPDSSRMAAIGAEQKGLVDGCDITGEQAGEAFGAIAANVDVIIEEEERALDLLR